jgi:hypothetical protein
MVVRMVVRDGPLDLGWRPLGMTWETPAAGALTHALVQLGEAESAHALAQDSQQRCRRELGPDHATTLEAATGLTLALAQAGEAEPAQALGRTPCSEAAGCSARATRSRSI